MMTGLGWLIAPAIAFLIAAATPGPANLALMNLSMRSGRRPGLAMAAGLTLGLAFWGGLVALGLGALVLQSATALTVFRIVGGLVLIWLAWKSARSAWQAAAVPLPAPPSHRTFAAGLILNLSNPKAAIAWGAAIAVGLPVDASAADLWLLTGICALIGAGNYLAYALLFSTARAQASYVKARRWIEGAAALILGGAGLALVSGRAGAAS
ncbi:MAG: LysE family translocator [Pseudomonadota bacterium]